MINANELRIGNLVDSSMGYVKVYLIDELVFRACTEFDYPPIEEDYQPIPLTPEILEKYGIQKGNFRNQYRFCGHYLDANNDGTFSFIIGDDEIDLASVKYLHQLQNLYFALTNKELEITL